MNEMVEKVARLLFDEFSGARSQNGGGWEAIAHDVEQQRYRQVARDLIGALREPTEAMLATGVPGYVSVLGRCNHTEFMPTLGSSPLSNWQRMIDAVLSPSLTRPTIHK